VDTKNIKEQGFCREPEKFAGCAFKLDLTQRLQRWYIFCVVYFHSFLAVPASTPDFDDHAWAFQRRPWVLYNCAGVKIGIAALKIYCFKGNMKLQF
jgi:hypothetical protein